MMWGQYCQETFGECISMGVCSIVMVAEIFRILIVLMSFVWKTKGERRAKQNLQGNPRICSFLVKSLLAVILTGVSTTQIFSINLAFCIIWFCALILERRLKGFTTKSTKASVRINFCLNAAISILSGRNSLDSADNLAFYCYVGYLGITGVFQIILSIFQKDFDCVAIDGLPSQEQSLLSQLSQEDSLIAQMKNAQKTDAKETKIYTSDQQERQQNGIERNRIKQEVEEEDKKEMKKQNTNTQHNDSDRQQHKAEIAEQNENNKAFIDAQSIKEQEEQTIPVYQTPEDSKKIDLDDEGNWSLKVADSPEICKDQGLNQGNPATNISSQQLNGENMLQGKIQNIRIDRFIEMIKYSKKTIVFEIKFTWCGRLGSIKRSLREFGALNSSLKEKYQEMPAFPSKKAQNTVLTFADLEERKKQLSVYLQALSNFCQPAELLGFLQSQEVFSGNNSRRASTRKSEDSIPQVTCQALTHSKTVPEIIWEEEDELALSEISK